MNNDHASLIEKEATERMRQSGRPFSKGEVVEIINTVIQKIEKNSKHSSLYSELKALAHYIDLAKEELAQLNPAHIGDEHIPSATDELDHVVKATEEATTKIMDNCEVIEGVCDRLDDGGDKDKLVDSVTNIYEACGFQDITGQRINKVVKTLKHIEAQVDMMVSAIGVDLKADMEGNPQKESVDDKAQPLSDEELLNGPQTQDEAISQDEIDKLLASFD